MSDLLGIFADNILPIFIVIGMGFAFGRRLRPNPQSLSRLTFYVFSPALVFSSLATSDLAGSEIGQIAVFTTLVVLLMGGLGWLAARWMRLDASATAGLVLVCMFVNGGNYGLGVNERAFGEDGLARAVIFFVTSTVLVYTLGVWIAVAGGESGVSNGRGALKRVLRVPPVYGVIAALVVRALSVDMTQPALEPVLAGVTIAGRAAIPAMLTILGMQLASTSWNEHARPAIVVSALRLLAAPLVAWGLAGVLGLTGVARQASIVEASMPAAVINIVLSTEYDSAPALVTSAVMLSTLISPVTLTLLLAALKA